MSNVRTNFFAFVQSCIFQPCGPPIPSELGHLSIVLYIQINVARVFRLKLPTYLGDLSWIDFGANLR